MTIQIRRDTAANWTAGNPTPLSGQPCWETDTNKLKIGDGATAWSSLPYFPDVQTYSVSSTATSYTETATSGEKIVKVTASGQTITLPTAAGNTAKFTFKLMVPGTLTIDGNGSQTIDGGLTATLVSQYEALTIISDNANWQVI